MLSLSPDVGGTVDTNVVAAESGLGQSGSSRASSVSMSIFNWQPVPAGWTVGFEVGGHGPATAFHFNRLIQIVGIFILKMSAVVLRFAIAHFAEYEAAVNHRYVKERLDFLGNFHSSHCIARRLTDAEGVRGRPHKA